MNRYIKVLSLCLSFVLVLTSCDKDFEEINTNPNAPTEVPAALLIPDIARVAMNTSYSTFVGGDMGSCWSQQLSKIQYNDEERYDPRVSVLQSTWDSYFSSVALDAKKMYSIAEAQEDASAQGVALVLQAYGFLFLTDCYGDIPFSEAGTAEEGNLTPAYDSQEAVYNGVIDMLGTADGLLAQGGSLNATADVIYGGDVSKWRKFANSLKFRALMRISDVSSVATDLQALVSAGNMFTSNDDEAKLVYLESSPNANPLYETIDFGNRIEFRTSEVLINYLQDRGDPRLAVYAEVNDDAGIYLGKPAGIADVPNDDWNTTTVSGIGEFYLSPTLPGYFMSYAQLQLLMAEAATKGYISGSAATYYNNGVNASFEANGLTGTSSVSSVSLQQIAEEEWLALYCQGVESWIEQRRTGYPVLTPAQDGAINEIPSRYQYPAGEQSLNGTNYTAAVARQGADKLTTKVWWDK